MMIFLYFIASLICGGQCSKPLSNGTDISVSGACEEGWFDASFIDLGCIFFLKETKVYYEANTLCQDMVSHLIEIHSQDQMNFIVNQLEIMDEGVNSWWTAGSDSGREDEWYWEHSLTPVEDFVWAAGYPRELTDLNYLCLYNTHDYMAIDCATTIQCKSICQK